MSKELKALDRMSIHRFDDKYEEWDADYEIVENYLEFTNNLEPSEALECLEKVKGYYAGGIVSVEVYLEETKNTILSNKPY